MISGKYLVVGSMGAAGMGVAGTATYFYVFREDILEIKIKNHFKDKNYMMILSSSSGKEWDKFKEFYFHSTEKKPFGIGKEGIGKWCEGKLLSRDSSSFDLVKKWCVIDSRTVQAKSASEGRKPIPLLGADQTQAWVDAWNNYNTKKSNLGLDIKDSTFLSEEKGVNTTGGPALKKWCETKAAQFMYEYLGEEKGYEKYYSWCTSGGG